MSLRVSCPECNAVFSVDEEMRGKKVRCRECEYAFTAVAPRPKRDDAELYEDEAEIDESAPASRRGDHEDDDADHPAPPPAKQKSKSGLVVALLVSGVCLAMLFVVCGGGGALVWWLWRSSEPPQVQQQPIVQMPPGGPGGPGGFGPGPGFPPVGQNPNQGGGGPIVLDPDPVVEPNPKVDPKVDPKVNPKGGPAPQFIADEIREKVKESSVYIHVRMSNGAEGSGSGFFAIEPGIVITNAHVMGMMTATSRPPVNVDVVLRAGQPGEQTLKGTILGVDRFTDLAVLRVVGDKLPPPLPVESANSLAELRNVYYFGFPLGKQLGTEISVGKGLITSVRRDQATRTPVQVQFDGNMQPGNSGGPVTDSAGRIVGIAVAIIPGKNICFAVASDQIQPIIDGRIDDVPHYGERYHGANKKVMLPVRYHLTNPLERVKTVRVEVWAGNAGPERAAAGEPPQPQPGDGPIESAAFNVAAGVANGDVALPEVGPNQVLWVRPVLVGPKERYLAAKPLPAYPYPPLDHIAANLQMKMDKKAERTLKLKDHAKATIQVGAAKKTDGLSFEADLLEVLTPAPAGTRANLTFGDNHFNDESNGQPIARSPAASQRLKALPQYYVTDPSGKLKVKGEKPPFNVPLAERGDMDLMYGRICKAFEVASVYMPNRTLQPRDTWTAVIPTVAGTPPHTQFADLHLTCTYDGSRTNAGRKEAVISLLGLVQARNKKGGEPFGKVRGRVVFDVEAGMATEVEVQTAIEIDTRSQARVLVTEDITLVRVTGNTRNIVAAGPKEPAAAPKTEPKTEPKAEPKAEPKVEPIVKNVLNIKDAIGKSAFLGPNGRKHKDYKVKLQAGVTYVIEMKQLTAPGGSTVNPYLMVLDSGRKEVARDDDSGGKQDAKIVFTAVKAGEYHVIATTRIGPQSGPYHLSVTAKD